MAQALYITYDGLIDPLGRSQILPYLMGLTKLGHEVHVISCEKPERFTLGEDKIRDLTDNAGIQWHPIPYTAKPPIFSTLKDVRKIFRVADKLLGSQTFDLVHCRSYIAALAGLSVKRKYDVPFVFDMRGFWIEERTEGGLWNLSVPWYRTVFNYFKKKEKSFLKEADQIVVLTEQAKQHLQNHFEVSAEIISVIPCCADEHHFNVNQIDDSQRKSFAHTWGIGASASVIGYLGSLGTWYALNEMLSLYDQLASDHTDLHFVLASNDDPPTALKDHPLFGKNIHCVKLEREQIPTFLSMLNACVYFIRPTFSKSASCPTKLGEALLMGVPVITNPGVGDIEAIISDLNCGLLVDFEAPELDYQKFQQVLESVDSDQLAGKSRKYFGLSAGVQLYNNIYTAISRESS